MHTLLVIWAWVLAHPAYVLLAWPALTALVNLVFGEAEKYATSHPWAHAILSFIEASGFDARGVLALLKKLLVKAPHVSVLVLLVFSAGCISSAPVVPVTPANAAQVSSCQNTAALHNGVVVGDFVLGGATSALGATGALLSDPQIKTDLSIAAAIVGGVTLAGTAIAGLTSSNFANSHCSDVVGPLPLGKKQ